ncbi:MAG: molybdopterin oxidoreductase family protein [Chloroflexota bacterium]
MLKRSLIHSSLNDNDIQIVTGSCPHDCPDTCAWQVAVDKNSGRALDIWGHPDHPITQGKLCGKVDRYLERTYHNERLTHPLRRTGAKGSGQFEPVSWDTAISEIAERLQQVVDTYGEEAVLPYSYAGTMGQIQGYGGPFRFFHKLGASQLARTICSEPGMQGYMYTIGSTISMEMEAFAHAKLILLWGTNTLTSNMHLWPFIQEARKKGAKVIVIDPAQTRTAQAADEWVPIHPGTDTALALAMMHVIIDEGLWDQVYVENFTLGFEQLCERVLEWTPIRAAEITGIAPERIEKLAREYARNTPAAIRINYGLQRHANGGMTARTIACLPALIGAWQEYGGGIQLSTSGETRHLDTTSLYRLDLLSGRQPRTINMIRLGDALSLDPAKIARSHYHPRPTDPVPTADQAGPQVKALFVYNTNPAAVNPDQAAVLQGLKRDDLFTVVLEHFQTDTADYADYLLPATTQLEHWDLIRPYGHIYLTVNRPAISPLGESLSNSEIFRRLARAMGFQDSCFEQDDESMLRELIEVQTHPVFDGVTWDALCTQPQVRLNVPTPYLPFAQGNFPTPSGKCEFYSKRMAEDGYDPLPNYSDPNWRSADPTHRGAAGAKNGTDRQNGTFSNDASNNASNDTIYNRNGDRQGSLVCISPPAHSFLNSTFVNVERFRQREEEPLLWIHPSDATQRDVLDKAAVNVYNELGCVTLTAKVTEKVMPGTVLSPGIWWNKLSGDGRNINQVTSQSETDMGGGATFYDLLVDVEMVDSEQQ